MGSERKSDAYRALARDTFPRSATNSWHFPLALPPLPVQGRASSWRAPRGGRRVRHGKDANSVLAGWFEPMKSSLVSPDEVCGGGQKDAGNLPVATVSLWPAAGVRTTIPESLLTSRKPSSPWARRPAVRQQGVDLARRVGRHASQHIAQVQPRVVAVHPGRLNQAHDRRRTLAREFTAGE
jgi:hypothetical protein